MKNKKRILKIIISILIIIALIIIIYIFYKNTNKNLKTGNIGFINRRKENEI